jgi:hypothetical protein
MVHTVLIGGMVQPVYVYNPNKAKKLENDDDQVSLQKKNSLSDRQTSANHLL